MIRGRQAQNLSRKESCQKFVIKFDLYKQPFRLLLPDEKDEYRTFCGSLLTIFTLSVTLVYAVLKLQILFNYKDYKVQERNLDEYYKETDRFSNNFMVAAGIPTGLDGQKHEKVPENIAALKFYRKTWTSGSNIYF